MCLHVPRGRGAGGKRDSVSCLVPVDLGLVRDPRHSLTNGRSSTVRNVTRCSACQWDLEGPMFTTAGR